MKATVTAYESGRMIQIGTETQDILINREQAESVYEQLCVLFSGHGKPPVVSHPVDRRAQLLAEAKDYCNGSGTVVRTIPEPLFDQLKSLDLIECEMTGRPGPTGHLGTWSIKRNIKSIEAENREIFQEKMRANRND